ncbi:hypothetical protein NC652_014942 [Populus alba x Populus x berolinensis]|nr:hypothetical protein NC652_014942 [Populus alba x Populus x berolinensis]
MLISLALKGIICASTKIGRPVPSGSIAVHDVFYPSIQHLGLEVGGLDRILVVIDSKGIGKLVAGDAPTPCSQL